MKMEAKKCPETVPIPCGTLPLGNGMAIKDGFYSSSNKQVGGQTVGPEREPDKEQMMATLSCAMVGPMSEPGTPADPNAAMVWASRTVICVTYNSAVWTYLRDESGRRLTQNTETVLLSNRSY